MTLSPPSPIAVTLIGCGTVGSGVLKVLKDSEALIRQRTGTSFTIKHIVTRNPDKVRAAVRSLPGTEIHADITRAVTDPAVKIVVELIGGTTTAHEAVKAALEHGKPVVTANKALLAAHGPELFALARSKGVSIAFEAACAGGIPIIAALTQGLAGNRIDALTAILNGTCNFILTQMTKSGAPYSTALAEAQKLGFAEADPTMDVSGRDTTQKLALLASLAFGHRITEAHIPTQGIDTLSPADITFARELGYTLKLLATAKRVNGSLSLGVAPTLVPHDNVLAEVSGSFNAVSVYGSAVGHTLFYGRGAGSLPTASAVVSDILQTALGVPQLAQQSMPLLSQTTPPTLLPPEETKASYYLRLTAKDQPGVLAAITAILATHKISIATFLQHPPAAGEQHVPLVITTHQAAHGAISTAIAEIDKLPQITAKTVCLRMLETPVEFAS